MKTGKWCVIDLDGNIVAMMNVEDEAICFQEVYYQKGEVLYKNVDLEILEEED